jgi:hypothetical protein
MPDTMRLHRVLRAGGTLFGERLAIGPWDASPPRPIPKAT